ncbi:MAG: type VI secretion system accessory protein TagJ [Planctomycetota bacterium]|jgi:type VI secretion system protein ImpE
MDTEGLLRDGQISEALVSLESQIRTDPADPKLRVFLFQLLCVLGDWPRAMTQLNVAAELDAKNLLMAHMYRPALNCEAFRTEVFAGERSPLIFGEPQEWIGWLVQAGQMVAEGKYEASEELRDRAFEAAPAVGGSVDGQQFGWICDADTRFGPILEAIVDGKYYWVPFTVIKNIRIEEPTDLRDVVWIPVYFTWTNGGESPGFIPTRYPGSHASEDVYVKLGRKTEWLEKPGQSYLGLGQRVLTTDKDEYGLLQIKQLDLDHPETDQQVGEE